MQISDQHGCDSVRLTRDVSLYGEGDGGVAWPGEGHLRQRHQERRHVRLPVPCKESKQGRTWNCFQRLIRLCNLQRLCQNFHYDDAARKSIKPHSQPQYLNNHLGQQVRLARLLSNSHKRILGDKMNQTASVGKLFYESFHWCNCPAALFPTA